MFPRVYLYNMMWMSLVMAAIYNFQILKKRL